MKRSNFDREVVPARSRGTRTTGAVVAGLAGLAFSSVGVGPAAATGGGWEPSHDEWGPYTSDDFCPGFMLTEQGEADSLSRTVIRGPDDLPHDRVRSRFTDTWTNPDTGEFVSQRGRFRGGDHRVTHNGDGTLTLVVRYTRNETFRNGGHVIGRETGVFGYTEIWDEAGTPADRTDDGFVTRVGDVINTGRNVDFCPMMIQALG